MSIFSSLSRSMAFAAAFAFGASALTAQAAPVAIPNADFSLPGNVGQIGGGLLGASATNVPIGSGPWTGSYYGVLGLLAPPQLTIANGSATIGGLAGVNVLGILDNGGYFSQALGTAYDPSLRYTLSAHVDVGGVLDLTVLAHANAGLALRNGASTLASTVTAPPQMIGIAPIGGTEYLLTLTFDAPEIIAGNIEVQLLGTPAGVIGVSLFPTVTYRAVSLDASMINPVAGSVLGVDGTLQQARVAQPFADALAVQVVDAQGDGVANVQVTFAAPATGASAVLAPTIVQTDASGFASTHATANTVAGSYTVTASVAGVDAPASFAFTNLAGPTASLTPVGPGAVQTADVSMPFDAPLVVGAADEFGNPTPGVAVDFSAPATGASATLSPASATTDASGLAQTAGTANAIAGTYAVVASVQGSDATASFALSNALPDGTTIVDDGSGDSPQGADLGAAFNCALIVHVAQPGGAPYPGVQVAFTAPSTGASATLSNGVDSGSTVIATTDASGAATVSATANDVGGDYTVDATLIGADGVDPVTFALRNLESLIFTDGFDRPCRIAP